MISESDKLTSLSWVRNNAAAVRIGMPTFRLPGLAAQNVVHEGHRAKATLSPAETGQYLSSVAFFLRSPR